jgi:peptide/nickel transport system permease protein
MGAYFVRRSLLMLLTLFGISVLIFVMLRLVPGNVTDIIFDSAGFVNEKQKKNIERELGLDKPIVTQYVNWIGGLAKGDLGYAYVSEKPAIDEILPRIPVTLKLATLTLIFSVLFGVPLGVISAVRQNTTLDYVLRVVSLSGLSLPSFWLGLLILMAFVHWTGWIPIYKSTPDAFWKEIGLLSIPAAAVGFRSSALIMRLTRSSMLEVLRQDYIRTARAKGASDTVVNYEHGLRNAMLPVVTIDRGRGGVPDRRADRHRNRVQYSWRGPLSGRSDPLPAITRSSRIWSC